MSKRSLKALLCCVVVLIKVNESMSLLWDHVKCSIDTDPNVPDGTAAEIGRFPWLGVVQHSFYIGGKVRFAITAGVLIHPAYAIAPAEDITKIIPDQLANNTKLILWHSSSIKYAISVSDFAIHPDYTERGTLATIAILQLVPSGVTGAGDNRHPVLPVCLPLSSAGTFTDLYAVKMTDEYNELQKEVYKVSYVDEKPCRDFYIKNHLMYDKMTPVSSICARAERRAEPCVWDGGVALVSRQAWGFWKILGFSVRGPGCGAPARFLALNDYMPWIHDVVSLTAAPPSVGQDVNVLSARRLSPIKIVLYNMNKKVKGELGTCERKRRGGVLYKDSFEVLMTKNFGQGFFYVIVTQIAQFNCAIIDVEEATKRSNSAIWLEHYCHRELVGTALGEGKRRNIMKKDCFLFYKTAAFVEFRFYFSFKALVEVTFFGESDLPKKLPNPWVTDETTDAWWPTGDRIKWDSFAPYYLWFWYL